MTDLRTQVHRALELYESALPHLEDRPDIRSALDRAVGLLRDSETRLQPVCVGLVGESQVGKSSLMNALLGRMALPAGGIGPLTAQAIRVSWGEEETMNVSYHGRARLNQLRFAIEQHLRRAGVLPVSGTDALSGEPVDEPAAAEETAFPEDDAPPEEATDGRLPPRIEFYVAQARRLLCEKTQTQEDLLDLVNGLRFVLGMQACGGRQPPAIWLPRAEALKLRLGQRETITRSSAGGRKEFDRELRLRAAEWLAPLVERLELSLNEELLRDLVLVDLPGIGVVGDDAAKVAGEFVRREAGGIVLVVPNHGVTDSIASLLEGTEVITRLLFAGRGDTLPVSIVVTHLDDVARTRFSERRKDALEEGGPKPDRHQIFLELAEPMRATVRRQLGEALRRSRSYVEAQADERAQRDLTITRLLDEVDVRCVAAPDYLNLTSGGEDLAFLQREEITGIPGLREQVAGIARMERERRSAAVRDALDALLAELRGGLEGVRGELRLAEDDAAVRARVHQEVTVIAAPLRERMKAYHGEVLGTLRNAIPRSILILCFQAYQATERRLVLLRRQGETLYYPSLRAALMHAGVWTRRDFDYPSELTRAFVDRIASEWEPKVVGEVRDQVARVAERDAKLLGELIEAVRAVSGVEVSPLLALQSTLPTRAKAAVVWKQDRFEALRRDVHDGLHGLVSREIETACDRALEAGKDRGQGAKRRILEVFEEGGRKAIDRARERAVALLNKHLEKLVGEIQAGYLTDNADPLGAAVRTLVSELPPPNPAAVQARRVRREAVERLLGRLAAETAA